MNTITKTLALLGLLGLCAPANAQSVIYEFNTGEQIRSMKAAGDFNGDGVNDLIIGNPYADIGSGSNSGRVKVYSGFDGSSLIEVGGENPNDIFGESVAILSDANGDGTFDILVGASGYGNQSKGRAYLISGTDGSIIWAVDGEAPYDNFGNSVSRVGDLNGDGIDEAVIGALRADTPSLGLSNTGKAYVLSGADGATIYSWHGDGTGDEFGSAVVGLGDINNDGVDDIAIGAPEDDNIYSRSGSVRIFSGATGGYLIFAMNGETENSRFGCSLAKTGDINLDGTPDLLVGAFSYSNNALGFGSCGAGYVMSTADGSILQRVEGHYSSDFCGQSICSIGDVNTDGIDDFLVGAPNGINFDNSNRHGYATVFSGATGSGLTNSIYGDNTYADFGRNVAGLGDVDGDTYPDYAVSSYNSIRVYRGNPFLGENYCVANLNTTGNFASIGGTGTTSVAANDLNLQVTGAVSNQFGVFYYGIGRTQVAFGYGWRCVGPPFRRLPVIQLDASGNGQRSFDNTPNPDIPQNLKIEVGDTFNFQFWFRDPAAGGPAFNLSDAVEITFYP